MGWLGASSIRFFGIFRVGGGSSVSNRHVLVVCIVVVMRIRVVHRDGRHNGCSFDGDGMGIFRSGRG